MLLIICVLLVVGRTLNKKIDSDSEMKSGLDIIEKLISAFEFGKRD